jgi:hypothetical protein
MYTPDQDEAGIVTPGDRTATFQLKNGVALKGGYAGLGAPNPNLRDIVLYETILSGDLAGDDARVACVDHSPNCDGLLGRLCVGGLCIINANNDENGFHVVTGNDTDASAILDGFTITGGNANGQEANGTAGGGMVNVFGSPTVQDCMFSSNSAIGIGGGMYNNSFVFGSSPTVTNCNFSSNFAAEGGGMFNNNYSRPTVTNCAFNDNSAAVNGGGAVNLNNSSPTMERCAFNGNRAARGGGMYNWNVSSPTLRNCMFARNSVSNQGGAMWNSFSNPAVTNCAFRDNAAGGAGGGMFDSEGSNPAVTNCTFTRNTAVTVGGGMFVSSLAAVPKVTNCILWGNLPTQIHVVHRPPVVNYSIVQGGWSGSGGVGVLNADPVFLDADGPDGVRGTEDDNLRLMVGSPAIDAGDNDAVPNGITTDLDGNPRFVDDPASQDCPQAPGTCGTTPIVDMGAYEFGSAPCGLADLDCDGDVDLRDFGRFQGCFGVANALGCNPIATPDLNGNGQVDLEDYVLFNADLTGPG